jgi:hypothetical protein
VVSPPYSRADYSRPTRLAYCILRVHRTDSRTVLQVFTEDTSRIFIKGRSAISKKQIISAYVHPLTYDFDSRFCSSSRYSSTCSPRTAAGPQIVVCFTHIWHSCYDYYFYK